MWLLNRRKVVKGFFWESFEVGSLVQFQLQVHAAFFSLLVFSYTQYINSIPDTVLLLVQFKILHSASNKQWLLSISLILPHQLSHVPGEFSFFKYFMLCISFILSAFLMFYVSIYFRWTLAFYILNPILIFLLKSIILVCGVPCCFFISWSIPRNLFAYTMFLDPQFDSRSLFLLRFFYGTREFVSL